jgi:hypothetical protein
MPLGRPQPDGDPSITGQFIRYFASSVVGGAAGAVSIIIAVIADLWWECKYQNRGCYDGQGGIVLVVLVPAMFVAGCFLGAVWTWLTSLLPSKSIFTSIYNYDGDRPGQNYTLAAGVSIGLWCAICFGLFRWMIYVDHP